jgi:hypothetical protein
MHKLILVVMFLSVISFACGYGLRDWISRRRRKEARKRFYEKSPKSHAHPSKTETMTAAAHGELTIRALDERLSRLEDRIR